MTNKRYVVDVRGKSKTFTISFYADDAEVENMRCDGLDVCELVHSMPAWVAYAGLAPMWCFFEDVWNFRWPFGR